MCGGACLKAAKQSSRASTTSKTDSTTVAPKAGDLHYTGLVANGCKHYCILGAVNMSNGEKYGLNHFLETQLLEEVPVMNYAYVGKLT